MTKRSTKILVIESGGRQPSASARLGVLDVLTPLEAKGICVVTYKKTEELKGSDISWADVLVAVRGWDQALLSALRVARDASRMVLSFLDDDLLNVPKEIGNGMYDAPQIKAGLLATLSLSHRLWVVNPILGEKYRKYCSGGVVCSRVPMLSAPEVMLPRDESGPVKIVYAGSPDHTWVLQKYLRISLQRLCEEFRNQLDITSIGADLGLNQCGNYHYHPHFADYSAYRRLMAESRFQIGLAVIEDQEFYHHKYFNKFLEYTAMGVAGIYTNALPYTLVVKNRENGLLCENTPEDWYQALREFVLDGNLRRSCLQRAQQALARDFTPQEIAEQLRKELPELEHYRAPDLRSRPVRIRNMKGKIYWSQIEMLWFRYKLAAIPLILWKGVRKIVRSIVGQLLRKSRK